MRILVTTTSGFGHIQPVLPLAAALRSRGHDLLWATGSDFVDRVAASGFAVHAVGVPLAERMATFARRYPEVASLRGEARAARLFAPMFGGVVAEQTFADLLELARRWQPNLVLHEAAELAGPIVAEAMGVPHVTHGFGLVVPRDRVAAASALTEPLWESIGLEARPFNGCYDHLYIDIYPPSMQPDDLSHVGRRQLLRPSSADAAPGQRLPAAVEQALVETGRPAVYLTFGTFFNDNPTFPAALAGLARLPVTVVATVGPTGDPASFGPQPANVFLERYIPQSLLFDHVAAVVSHVGSGTLLASLGLGLPQVCIPQAADQFRNTEAVVAAGAGVGLTALTVKADDVTAAATQVLEDARWRAGAARVADEIAAMPSTDEVAAVVEAVAG